MELFPPSKRYKIFKSFQKVYYTSNPERIFMKLVSENDEDSKEIEFHIFKLSPNEIITLFNDPSKKFDLRKVISSYKDLLFQIRLLRPQCYFE